MINVSQAQKAHQRFLNELKATAAKELKEAGRRAQDITIADKSFGGTKLRHSIYLESRRKYSIKIYTRSPVAQFIEDGTEAHVIRARRKKFLHFFSERLNRFVFAKAVNHPGSKKGQRFFTRANEQAFAEMCNSLDASLSRIPF